MARFSRLSGLNELLDCSICRERKKDRCPRALICLHSFCSECLKEWHFSSVREGLGDTAQIPCPVCRTVTILPELGIEGLTVDFKVESAEELMRFNPDCVLCQGCTEGKDTAKVKCVTCNRRLCADCLKAHMSMDLGTAHETEHLCDSHGAELTHLCQTCMAGLCVDCLWSKEHVDHAIGALSDSTETVKCELKRLAENVRLMGQKLQSQVEAKTALQSRDITAAENSITKRITTLRRLTEEGLSVITDQQKRQLRETIESSVKLNMELCVATSKMLDKVTRFQTESGSQFAAKLSSVFSELQQMQYNISGACESISASGRDDERREQETASDVADLLKQMCSVWNVPEIHIVLCDKPTRALEIAPSGSVEVNSPSDIAVLSDGSVVVADSSLTYVSRFNVQGNLIAKYYDQESVTSIRLIKRVTSHHDIIYFASGDGKSVSRVGLDETCDTLALDPPVSQLTGLAVDGDHVLLANTNQLSRLNVNTQHTTRSATKVKVSRLKVVHVNGTCKYIITEYATRMVHLCNRAGEIICTLKDPSTENANSWSPQGACVTSNGNILVADWAGDRVSEFSPNGKFIRHLLNSEDGIYRPNGLAYVHPYLWVSLGRSLGPRPKLLLFTYVEHPQHTSRDFDGLQSTSCV